MRAEGAWYTMVLSGEALGKEGAVEALHSYLDLWLPLLPIGGSYALLWLLQVLWESHKHRWTEGLLTSLGKHHPSWALALRRRYLPVSPEEVGALYQSLQQALFKLLASWEAETLLPTVSQVRLRQLDERTHQAVECVGVPGRAWDQRLVTWLLREGL